MTRLLRWGGSSLALFGVVFVGIRLWNYSGEVAVWDISAGGWLFILMALVVYALANLLLAVAWWLLLRRLGANVSRGWATRVFGISQLGKYLPGNVFHIAGRQALGMADAIEAKLLLQSAFGELLLLCLAGGVCALLSLPLFMDSLGIVASLYLYLLAGSLVACASAWLFGRKIGLAFILYNGFLLASGAVFVMLLGLSASLSVQMWLPAIGAFVVAWLVGMLTPGAPAGVGVRELVLFTLLGSELGESGLLLTIVLSRLVTVMGDLAFYTYALAARKHLLKATIN